MYTEDIIIGTLLKYDFELYRESNNVADFLETHLANYYSDISNAITAENRLIDKNGISIIANEMDSLKDICARIPQIIRLYNNGHLKDVYEQSVELFSEYSCYFIVNYLFDRNSRFYRIRRGDYRIKEGQDSKKIKRELFHIGKDKCSNIGAYRYSIPGYPCLYLSTDRELPWFECDMPDEFSYCEIKLDEREKDTLKVIDFAERPIDFLTTVTSWLRSSATEEKRSDQYNVLMRYILSYPFAAACSIRVKNRQVKFVEEYVFPQLLMSWIRDEDNIDGIIYKSSLDSGLVKCLGAKNVALVTKDFREDGLDKILTTELSISDIGYINVVDYFNGYKEKLSEISILKFQLQQFMFRNDTISVYLYSIIELIETVTRTYSAIIEKKYENASLLFTNIERLVDYKDILFANSAEKIEKAKSEKEERGEKFEQETAEQMIAHTKELLDDILTKNHVFKFGFESLENFEHI